MPQLAVQAFRKRKIMFLCRNDCKLTKKEKNKNRVYRKTTPSTTNMSVIHNNVTTHHASSNNTINPLRNKVARESKCEKASGNAPEPRQIALVLLARHPDVHAPHTRDNVHGQDDGAEDGEFAEDVGGLLGALVHADVDLGEVVAVGAGEEAVRVKVSFLFFWVCEVEGRVVLTSRSDSGCLSW